MMQHFQKITYAPSEDEYQPTHTQPWLPIECPVKTLIRPNGYADCSEFTGRTCDLDLTEMLCRGTFPRKQIHSF